MKTTRLFCGAVCLCWLLNGFVTFADSLDDNFLHPPAVARPWVFWVWLHADTTPAAITRDLEEMKAKGITGCILYDTGAGNIRNENTRKMVVVGKEFRPVPTGEYKGAYSTPVPAAHLQAWTPHWRELVRFAAGEAARLKLDFCLTDGLANTSGPIEAKDGEQVLAWAEVPVTGPQTFDATLPGKLKEVGEVRHTVSNLADALYYREVAVYAVPDGGAFATNQVVDLSSQMDATGQLHWEVPAGKWRILRWVQVATGAKNDWGLYADSLSAGALDHLWDVTMAPLLHEMTPEQRRGLVAIEDDSWESGRTGWTERFPEEFLKRRGYDLMPWLPVLAGKNLGDAATRARVLRDYNLTVSDLIVDNHYAHLRQLANANGLTCYSEPAGPNYSQADDLKTCSRVDVAMAEFWMPSTHRPTPDTRFLLRNAASANHVYGKPLTMCESFTSVSPQWEETPFTMKPVADQAFCDGLNRVCVHAYSHSPSLTAKPGYVYWAGTHYDRNITWWEQSPAFNDYLARCSAMLQAGKFVADAVFYHGDNIGLGEPRKKPMATLGAGYDHDNANSEVLLTRMTVKNGRIMLPDGMSYRVLVLPEQEPMTLAVLKKIAALLEAGATVVGPRPTGLAGMARQPGEEAQFNALADRLWNGLDGKQVTEKNIGAGRLCYGQTVRQVLAQTGTPPDFEVGGVSAAGEIDWIHRETADASIYFVASRWEQPEKVDGTFRVVGRQPELWNPVTGEIRDAVAFRQADGRTVAPLELDPCGSVFVVFRRPIDGKKNGAAAVNYPALQPQLTLTGDWTVNFDPQWGGPKSVVFDALTDWTSRPEAGIKFYSGTAVYHKKFDLAAPPAAGQRLWLDLGEVHEVASVRLNGHDLGGVWARPARVDITGAVQATGNDLEVTVVNLWPNRLKGDEAQPKAARFTETNMHKFGAASPLLPSGLLGPVTVQAGE